MTALLCHEESRTKMGRRKSEGICTCSAHVCLFVVIVALHMFQTLSVLHFDLLCLREKLCNLWGKISLSFSGGIIREKVSGGGASQSSWLEVQIIDSFLENKNFKMESTFWLQILGIIMGQGNRYWYQLYTLLNKPH